MTSSDNLRNKFPGASIYLLRDFTVGGRNLKRKNILESFLDVQQMSEVNLNSLTYHHFMGNGESDSYLDKICFSSELIYQELLFMHLCKLDEALIWSQHDILLTKLAIAVDNDVMNNE